jgi:outer membrane protein assembly factor BamB
MLGERMLSRVPRFSAGNIVLLLAIGALLSTTFAPGASLAIGATPTSIGSGLSPLVVTTPTVAAHEGLVVTSTSATSGGFLSNSGDTVVVFLSVDGKNTATVSDSTHDTFTQLASITQNSPSGYSSLWMFAAYNVAAGSPKTVTASLSGTSTDNAAADIVDVTGVGPTPLDQVAVANNYSLAGNLLTASLNAPDHTSDLILSVVAAHQTRDWTPSTKDALLNDAHAPSGTASMTAADFDRVATYNGKSWLNASTTAGAPYWMSDGLSLRGSGVLPTGYPVTFDEKGLSAGQAWYVVLGTTATGTTNSSVSFSATNGSYRYTVGAISGVLATPATGTIVVAGASVTLTISFARDTNDWPTYLGEVTRNSANYGETAISSANAQNLTELWSAPTGPMQAQPAVVNGSVYVGALNGNEYALNASTGAVQWSTYVGQVISPGCYTAPTGITSSATVTGGMVYVGGGNNTGNATNGLWVNGTTRWYALDAATGKIAWSIPIGIPVKGSYNWASPLIVNGYAYIGNASRCDQPLVWGGLFKVSLATHAVVGFFNATIGSGRIGASIWGSPTYVPSTNTIYVATGNPLKTHTSLYSESVVAINATTLVATAKWQVPLNQTIGDSDFGTTPDYYHLANGSAMVSALNKNGIVYAFNATNVSPGPVWENKVSYSGYPQNVAPQAFGDGLLFAGTGPGNVSGKPHDGTLQALYPNNGTLKWAAAFQYDVFGAPVYSNGIVVAAGGNDLKVFNATTGQLLWNWTCAKMFDSAPSIAEGRIYAGCNAEYAFGFKGTVPTSPPGHAGTRGSVLPTPEGVSSRLLPMSSTVSTILTARPVELAAWAPRASSRT